MSPLEAFGAGGVVALLVALVGLARELVKRRRPREPVTPPPPPPLPTFDEETPVTEPPRPFPLDTSEEEAMSAITLTADQHAMVQIIQAEAERVQLGFLFRAAVVNAYAESLLDPLAIGDNGRSVGLFQLHDRGAGMGMSVEQRQDPELNARRIFEVVLGTDGVRLRSMQWAPDEDMAAEFAHSIERCAACGWQAGDSELHRRRALVARLFPSVVT